MQPFNIRKTCQVCRPRPRLGTSPCGVCLLSWKWIEREGEICPRIQNNGFLSGSQTERGDTERTAETGRYPVKVHIEFFLCILILFDRFRSGETNTVASTNVIEEGLDVRSCNLVIKFDFPATFRWGFPTGETIRHLTSQLGPGRTCRAKEEQEQSPVGTSSWQARRKLRKLRQNSTSLEELKGWRSRNVTSLKTMTTR